MTEEQTTLVAIYIRTSPSEEGYEAEIQRARCQALAKCKGWDIYKYYEDLGVDGSLDESQRPALRQMLHDAKDYMFDAVIFLSLNRLGKRFSSINGIIEHLRSLDIKLAACVEPIDTTCPTGRFLINVYASLTEFLPDIPLNLEVEIEKAVKSEIISRLQKNNFNDNQYDRILDILNE